MARRYRFVDSVEQVAANNERPHDHLAEKPMTKEIKMMLAGVSCWYAIWTRKGWKFGHDGVPTQGKLLKKSVRVGKSSSLYGILRPALSEFLDGLELAMKPMKGPKRSPRIRVLVRPVKDREIQWAASECGLAMSARIQCAGWSGFSATAAPEWAVYISKAGPRGPWFLDGADCDLRKTVKRYSPMNDSKEGDGGFQYEFSNKQALIDEFPQVHRALLLDAMVRQANSLPKKTEVRAETKQRVGQDLFRARLMEVWEGRCPLTEITDKNLLRASHIVPWKDCDDDSHRLDENNGLLLSSLWDAAFDKGLVSFRRDGTPMYSAELSDEAEARLQTCGALDLNDAHWENLYRHQEEVFRWPEKVSGRKKK